MKILLRSTLAATVACCALAVPASSNTLYFQSNRNYQGLGDRQAFIFGAPGTAGTITGPEFNQSFTLDSTGFALFSIPLTNELVPNTIETKGFRIDSPGSVSGYFLSRQRFTTDITYLIDGSRLGTDHVVAGYQDISPDQISVQATVDNTLVTFRPVGQAELQVTLNAGQTYLYSSSNELTGSRVLGSAPIAVFSGNECSNVPRTSFACDHLVEQVPSVDLLSTSYIVSQTARTGTAGNVVRVVATTDGTVVTRDGVELPVLNAGQYTEFFVTNASVITANNKIMVAQYLIGQQLANAQTDPALAILPGTDQWLKSYVFATPSGAADFPTDFVNIIVRTDNLDSLQLNGAGVNTALFTSLEGTPYSFGNIDVSTTSGPFSITARDPFQLLLYGVDETDSYFTFGGALFSPGASVVTSRLYWDGDGEGNADNSIVDGGNGIWTATATNFTTSDGATNGAYSPQPGNVVFAGSAGTVTVDNSAGAIGVTGMAFNTSGYRINGGAITLNSTAGAEGPAATNTIVSVGEGAEGGAAFVATIDAPLIGTAGLAKTGPGTLVLNGSNLYTGGTLVSGGTLIGNAASFGTGAITDNAALVFDQPGTISNGNQTVPAPAATFANGINGTGTLAKRGTGTLILAGSNGLTGATTVEAGRLLVNGQLATSAVTVRNGATVGGTGRTGSLAIQAGGIVAPGNSIGTLNVSGNYTQAAGAFYDVELTSTGSSDRIAVVGNGEGTGTATLAPGAVLRFTKLDTPRFVLGTRYTVLTTTAGRSGTFTLSGPTRVSRFIDVVGTYDANNAYLSVNQTSRFVSAARTLNQTEAASGADDIGNGAMFQGIVYLQTDAEAQAAFDLVSGELHASLRGAAFEDSRFVREAVVNHLLHPEDSRRGLWFHGYGSWGRIDGDGNAAKLRRDLGGFFMGVDVVNTDKLTFGLLGGYGAATVTVADRASRAETDDIQAGLYAGVNFGKLHLKAGTGYMWRKINSQRSVAFTGFADSLNARYQARTFQVFGDLGYRFDFGKLGIEPFAAAAYVNLNSDGWRENGGSAALTANRQSVQLWTTNLGARLSHDISSDGRFGFVASGSWRRTGGADLRTPYDLAFAAGPVFTIYGPPIARDAAAVQARLQANLMKGLTLEAGYSGQFGNRLDDHGFNATLSLAF